MGNMLTLAKQIFYTFPRVYVYTYKFAVLMSYVLNME